MLTLLLLDSSVAPLAVILTVALAVAAPKVLRILQQKETRRFAQSLGFTSLGWEIADLPTNLLDELEPWDKAHDVWMVDQEADRILFFAVEQGLGKRGSDTTIVARRYTHLPQRPPVPRGFLLLEYGHWRAITRKRGFVATRSVLSPEAIKRLMKILKPTGPYA